LNSEIGGRVDHHLECKELSQKGKRRINQEETEKMMGKNREDESKVMEFDRDLFALGTSGQSIRTLLSFYRSSSPTVA
jgi:hypothetical protein